MSARATAPRAGYGALLRVAGYPPLLAAMTLSRVAVAMSQVTLIVYLLERTRSPALAGLGAVAQLVPGIVSGPFLGAWLDRTPSRTRLVVLTQAVRAALLLAVVVAGRAGGVPVAVDLLLLAGLGVTFPLPIVGFRSIVPALVPERLWTPANAADSISYDVAYALGPAAAGVVVTLAGAAEAIVLQAAVALAAGLAAARVREPAGLRRSEEPALAAVANGLRTVFGHRELRASLVVMACSGAGLGVLTIALPLWVRDGLGRSPGAVGWLWAALSAGSIVGGLVYGRHRPRGSDATHMTGFALLLVLPLVALPHAGSLAGGMVAMAVAGLLLAPGIIAMFGIRQRSVDHHLHGRVFAITVSLNAAAMPLGALAAGLAAGPLGVHRLLQTAAVGQLAAALAGWLFLRERAPRHVAAAPGDRG